MSHQDSAVFLEKCNPSASDLHTSTSDKAGTVLYSSVAEDNKHRILSALTSLHLPSGSLVLEVASGTGQHVLHLAERLPHLQFQPSDINPHMLHSIQHRLQQRQPLCRNILPPVHLDVLQPDMWRRSVEAASVGGNLLSEQVVDAVDTSGYDVEDARGGCEYVVEGVDGLQDCLNTAQHGSNSDKCDKGAAIRSLSEVKRAEGHVAESKAGADGSQGAEDVADDVDDVDGAPVAVSGCCLDCVLCVNLLHVSSAGCNRALLSGCSRSLRAGGALVLYGPFLRHGEVPCQMQRVQDKLRAENPDWGLPDADELISQADNLRLRLISDEEIGEAHRLIIWRKW